MSSGQYEQQQYELESVQGVMSPFHTEFGPLSEGVGVQGHSSWIVTLKQWVSGGLRLRSGRFRLDKFLVKKIVIRIICHVRVW